MADGRKSRQFLNRGKHSAVPTAAEREQIRREVLSNRAEWDSLSKTQRRARVRELKKLVALRVCEARREVFDTWIRVVARQNPHGRVGAASRWFETAWRDALRPGSP